MCVACLSKSHMMCIEWWAMHSYSMRSGKITLPYGGYTIITCLFSDFQLNSSLMGTCDGIE